MGVWPLLSTQQWSSAPSWTTGVPHARMLFVSGDDFPTVEAQISSSSYTSFNEVLRARHAGFTKFWTTDSLSRAGSTQSSDMHGTYNISTSALMCPASRIRTACISHLTSLLVSCISAVDLVIFSDLCVSITTALGMPISMWQMKLWWPTEERVFPFILARLQCSLQRGMNSHPTVLGAECCGTVCRGHCCVQIQYRAETMYGSIHAHGMFFACYFHENPVSHTPLTLKILQFWQSCFGCDLDLY